MIGGFNQQRIPTILVLISTILQISRISNHNNNDVVLFVTATTTTTTTTTTPQHQEQQQQQHRVIESIINDNTNRRRRKRFRRDTRTDDTNTYITNNSEQLLSHLQQEQSRKLKNESNHQNDKKNQPKEKQRQTDKKNKQSQSSNSNNNDINVRIIGGKPVQDDTIFPYYGIPAGNSLCGATMIWEDIGITAAHCGTKFSQDGIQIGGIELFGTFSGSATFVPIVKEYIHPNYTRPTSGRHEHDIMLLQLINATIPPPYVQLNWDSTLPIDNEQLTVIGYGNTIADQYSASPVLLKTTFQSISYNECTDFYNTAVNYTTMICAGTDQGGQDSCQGDSGGPVFIEKSTTTTTTTTTPGSTTATATERSASKPQYIQAGIVSFGSGCGEPGVPSGNTRISYYKQWIQSELCRLSKNPPKWCSPSTWNTKPKPTTGSSTNINTKGNSTVPKPKTKSPWTNYPTKPKPVQKPMTKVPWTNYPTIVSSTSSPINVGPWLNNPNKNDDNDNSPNETNNNNNSTNNNSNNNTTILNQNDTMGTDVLSKPNQIKHDQIIQETYPSNTSGTTNSTTNTTPSSSSSSETSSAYSISIEFIIPNGRTTTTTTTTTTAILSLITTIVVTLSLV